MTKAIFGSLSAATPGDRQAASPAIATDTRLAADVTGFYDAPTGSIQYVVSDPITRRSAIIDPVLDFDETSGATANALLHYDALEMKHGDEIQGGHAG